MARSKKFHGCRIAEMRNETTHEESFTSTNGSKMDDQLLMSDPGDDIHENVEISGFCLCYYILISYVIYVIMLIK